MTQPVSMFGAPGEIVPVISPQGTTNLFLGGSPGGPTQLFTFNTVIAGAAGSGRLIDMPTSQFLALPNGTIAYTKSCRAFWVRFTSPTAISSDTQTVLKPLGGASREVWLRMQIPDRYSWVQSAWHIDEVNGNFENDGLTQLTALNGDAERNRRLGYRAPCSQLTTVTTYGAVTTLSETRFYSPGGQTNYFSKNAAGTGPGTVAFTSAAGFTAHTNYAAATNTEQDATDATVPTGTWAGAGFTPSAGRAAHRVRFTAGANANGVMWVKHDQAAGKANFSRLIVPSTDVTLAPAAGANIVNGDAYVVETLSTCSQLLVDVEFQDAGTTFFGEYVTFNDYAFAATVAFTNYIAAPAGGVRFNGCDLENLVPELGTLFGIACNVDGPIIGQFGDAGQYWMQGCCVVQVNSGVAPTADGGTLVLSEFTCAEGQLFTAGYGSKLFVQSAAGYRSTGPAGQITAKATVAVQPVFGGSGGAGVLFGSGNIGAGVQFFHGADLAIRTIANVTITGTGGDYTMGGNATGYAWDDTNHVYAAGKRNFTWALLATAFGGGGFGSSQFDPLSTCSAVISSS